LVAQWDGHSWTPFGWRDDSQASFVSALEVYKGKLYAGGFIDSIGGVQANGVAAWDGAMWSSLGGGLVSASDVIVAAMQVYDDMLIVAGNFNKAAGTPVANVAAWDGANWSSLGSGIPSADQSQVLSMETIGDRLYAGGYFFVSGAEPISNIAAWDGTEWSALGSGITISQWGEVEPGHIWDLSVGALQAFRGNLMVGGSFLKAGDKASSCIAMWTKTATTEVDDEEVEELPTEFSLTQNYPNPFNPSTTIEYTVPVRSRVTITVYNILGRQVRTLVDREESVGQYRVTWDGTDQSGRRVASGVYLYRFTAGEYSETRKLVVIK
jgi:hypothetical protein